MGGECMNDIKRKEIILTDKYNTTTDGRPFPKTPPPEIRYDGIFPMKKEFDIKEIILNFKNKLKRQ